MYEPFYIKTGNRCVQVIFAELLYVEAKNKSVKVITTNREYSINISLNAFEKILPSRYFCRINRSQIISLLHTKEFINDHAIVSGNVLHISKQYKEKVFNRIPTFNTDPRTYIILSDYDTLTLIRKITSN